MIITFILSMMQVAVTTLGARALGRHLLKKVREFPHPALQVAVETGLGLALVSYVLFVLVIFGAANRISLAVLMAALALSAVIDCKDGLRTLARVYSATRWSLPLVGVGAVLVVVVASLAVLPPTAIDELIYHLEVPRQILQVGGWTLFQDNIYAYFPQLGEMFFLFGLGLSGEVAAKLFHGLFGLLLALAIFGFSRARLSAGHALFAAIVFLTVPTVIQLLSIAYVDLLFAFYAFLAFCSLFEYFRERSAVWLLLSGLFAGGAWAVKYTGMQYTMLLFVLVLLEHLISRRKKISPYVLLLPLVSFLVVSPYLVRNWATTGWPLFPFNLGPFSLSSGLNWDIERGRLFLKWLSGFGSGGDLTDKMLAPILVFVRGEFGNLARFDGVAGPVFLFVPVLLLLYKKSKESWLIILFTGLLIYYWAFTTQQLRFLLPVLPILAYLLAEGLQKVGKRPLVYLAGALVVWNLGVGFSEAFKGNPARFWTGRESREQFLTARVMGYPLYQETNRVIGESGRGAKVFLVNMRNFGYFLDCPWRADFVFEYFRLGGELESADKPSALLPFFQEMGITHLMIDEAVTLSSGALPPREQNLLSLFLRNHTKLVSRNALREAQALREIVFEPTGFSR
jgi:4-amino-4-deoxy-L-arabinose transferase-like glycosyltransferase